MNELKLPELGENIDQVDVSAVLVAVGEFVRRDQPVVEVETEKASLEVPATREGTVIELLVKQGDDMVVVYERGFVENEYRVNFSKLKKLLKTLLKREFPRSHKIRVKGGKGNSSFS